MTGRGGLWTPEVGAPLLAPPTPGWPAILRVGALRDAPLNAPQAAIDAALATIRTEALFWPAPRAGASTPRALALDKSALAAARGAFPDEDVLLCADAAAIAPDRLEAVYGAGPAALWAVMGGLEPPGGGHAPDAGALLGSAPARSPWTAEPITLEDAVAAQALLRRAAMRARGPVALMAMSPWKRRCLRPFLTGPDGPPRAVGAGRRRHDAGGRFVTAVWGDAPGPDDALRIEDGFLRSVGLGIRHTPPLSLVIGRAPPHFDATQPNGFERLIDAAVFDEPLLARARRLRARVTAAGLTKYNLPVAAPPPDAGGQMAVLAVGQVATDASIRLGARAVRDDAALLRATRARFPGAFILYKPHPDVLLGWRRGAAPDDAVRACADAVETQASMTQCLAWADRVAVITSLAGFEALMRGCAVTTFGRPFYAGWGLTDDADPPPRTRTLSLDALCAAALIQYASYVDPDTGLPCPAEIVVERLIAERARSGSLSARARRAWRAVLSAALNRL